MNQVRPAKLPPELAAKASRFPECHMGVNRANLLLKDKAVVRDVFLAWGEEIVRIGEKEIEGVDDLEFRIVDIEDVERA